LARKRREKDDYVELVKTRRLQGASATSTLRSIWRESYRLYKCYLEEPAKQVSLTPEYMRATLFVPETFAEMETLAPRLLRGMFASRPTVRVLAFGDSDAERQHALDNEALLDYQLHDVIRFPAATKAGVWVRLGLLFGMAPALVSWRVDKRKVWQRAPVSPGSDKERQRADMFPGSVRQERQRVEQTTYDDPDVTPILPQDVWWDPGGNSVETCTWVIVRSYPTLAMLKRVVERNPKQYHNMPDVEDAASTTPQETASESLRAAVSLGGSVPGHARDRRLILDECYTDDEIVSVVNESIFISRRENPYNGKPLVIAVVTPEITNLCGIAPTEVIRTHQYELNDLHNQRMDALILGLLKTFVAREGSPAAHADLSELLRPLGRLVTTDIANDIKALDLGTVPMMSSEMEATLKAAMQEATAAYDFMRGGAVRNRETATAVRARTEGGSFRFGDYLGNLETTGVYNIARQIIEMNQAFVAGAKSVRLANEKMRNIPVGGLDGKFHYMVAGSAVEPIADKDLRRQQLLQFIAAVSRRPELTMLINWRRFMVELLAAFEFRDPDNYIQPAMPAVPGMPPGVGAPPGVGPTGIATGPATVGPHTPELAPRKVVPANAPRAARIVPT